MLSDLKLSHTQGFPFLAASQHAQSAVRMRRLSLLCLQRRQFGSWKLSRWSIYTVQVGRQQTRAPFPWQASCWICITTPPASPGDHSPTAAPTDVKGRHRGKSLPPSGTCVFFMWTSRTWWFSDQHLYLITCFDPRKSSGLSPGHQSVYLDEEEIYSQN